MTRQIARLALSGAVIIAVADAVCAGQSAADKEVQTRKTAAVKPKKESKPVLVVLSGSPCDHYVSTNSVKLDAKKKDTLVWVLMNECDSSQDVLLCAYKGSDLFNPFKICTSRPTSGLGIGKSFTVARWKPETVGCEADIKGMYEKVLFTGKEIPKDRVCPSKIPPKGPTFLTHRLGVEIIR